MTVLEVPQWQSTSFNSNAPEALQPWLTETGSMTQRLKALSAKDFNVEVLSQSKALPGLSEKAVLGADGNNDCIIREAYLFLDAHPCIYGRTVIPVVTLENSGENLQNLGASSIGIELFKDSSLKRSPIEITCFTQNQEEYKDIVRSLQPPITEPLWGRRSTFTYKNHPLLITEVFLPELLQLIAENKE